MKNRLKEIETFVAKLNKDAFAALEIVTINKQYKKGEFLLKQNEICKHSFHIIDGCARKYYLSDGKEITTELFFKDDLAVSFSSYTLQQPGYELIQAICDTTVSVTEYDAFQKIKNKHPQLLQLDLMITEYYAMWLEERLFQFHTLNALSRYRLLLTEHPHAVQQVQLTHIASYLGITLETLSRIRAKI